ncbi:hypothetical protein DOY81_002600 [Sarcophaga bullata]|nr:hypothetical protein DOY81_002600 [Sarcophaga bullata]
MNKVIEIIDSDDDNHTTIDKASSVPTITSSTSMELEDNIQSQSRRRRRKSVLHAMTDPDMQFQTIAVDDDDDEEEADKPTQINYQPTNKPNAVAVRPIVKNQKTTPKILTLKSSTGDDAFDAAYEKFLNDPETVSDMYSIAEERTRINYLLGLNGIPEISFTLHTRPDRWQFQFEERLKQRKLLHNWDNTRVQENRRSLLQNNNDQNVQ